MGTTLGDGDGELKLLWKDHFARQITVSELTVMRTFQGPHLNTGYVAKVATLSDGKFDDTVLYRLLSSLSTSFELYNPDNTVMIYLKQHSQALRGNTSLIFDLQKKRGTHTNHTHDECKFKESEANKHPNVGKAPPKKQRNAKTNASQPAKNAHEPYAKADGPKCYTAGNLGIYPMRVLTKAKSKPALRARCTKIKVSWRCGKEAHLPTPINRNAPHASSNLGDIVCPYTDVTPTI